MQKHLVIPTARPVNKDDPLLASAVQLVLKLWRTCQPRPEAGATQPDYLGFYQQYQQARIELVGSIQQLAVRYPTRTRMLVPTRGGFATTAWRINVVSLALARIDANEKTFQYRASTPNNELFGELFPDTSPVLFLTQLTELSNVLDGLREEFAWSLAGRSGLVAGPVFADTRITKVVSAEVQVSTALAGLALGSG